MPGNAFQSLQQDSVVDSVEGCAEIQQDQNAEIARVSSQQKVIGHYEQGLFSAVLLPETRFEWVKKHVGGKMVSKLSGHNALKYFGKERKLGYGPVVSQGIRIKVFFFFEDRYETTSFQGNRNMTMFKGRIYHLYYQRTKQR